MTMTINTRNKIQTDTSLLFTPEVRTDLTCTQNPRRERLTISITKNIEDLFKSMDFTIFEVKSDKIL